MLYGAFRHREAARQGHVVRTTSVVVLLLSLCFYGVVSELMHTVT